MKNQIYPCIWFNDQAQDAAAFYCSIFKDSKITQSNPMVTMFSLNGRSVMGLNGGPQFTLNPSISLYVTCKTVEEMDAIWAALSDGANRLMPLGKYPWSEHYGWLADKFGLNWQLNIDPESESQTISPLLLFVGDKYGKGEEAMQYYTSLFPKSSVTTLHLYEDSDPVNAGKLKFAQFYLHENSFMAMDGSGQHDFTFNEAVSFVVSCDDQEEIDFFWNRLTEGGEESRCGWLKDRYGVSWQIIPAILQELMADKEKSPAVVNAFMQMKKMEIDKLLAAS